MATAADVRNCALALEGVREIDHWGRPAYRTTKRIFAVLRPDGLFLHLPEERKQFLFEAAPEVFVKFMWGKTANVTVQIARLPKHELQSLIREAWQAAALLALEGAGTACFWPGQSTLLSRLTRPERTHSAFALQRISMNLGLGLGGVIGGLIASTSHPGSFTTLFLLDAATFLVFVGILATVHEPAAKPLVRDSGPGTGFGGTGTLRRLRRESRVDTAPLSATATSSGCWD